MGEGAGLIWANAQWMAWEGRLAGCQNQQKWINRIRSRRHVRFGARRSNEQHAWERSAWGDGEKQRAIM